LAGMVLAATRAIIGRLGGTALAGAITLASAALSGVLIWKFPGASHLGLALWVSGLLLFAIAAWPPERRLGWLAALAALGPVLVLWVPLMGYLEVGMGIVVWPIEAVLVALCVALVAVAPVRWPKLSVWRTSAIAGGLMIVLLLTGLRAGRYSPRQPQPANVIYVQDANANAAFWVTARERLDPWSAAILGPAARRQKFPEISGWLGGEERFWKSPAPLVSLPPPQLELLSAECTNDWRTFDVKVASPRGAPAVLVIFQSDHDTQIVALDGHPPHLPEQIPSREHPAQYVEVRGLPPEGMTLRVRIRGCGRLLARLVEWSPDLAPAFPQGVPPLPPGMMTAWEDDYYNRCVMVTRRLAFE